MKKDYLGVDTETGGTVAAVHALLAIGACCTWAEAPFLVYITAESQPGKTVESKAAEKNGYSPEKWDALGAVPIADGMKQFRDWIHARRAERPGAVAVCHNLPFDKPFLEEGARMAGVDDLPMRYDWRCSMLAFCAAMDDWLIARGSASLDRLADLSGHWEPGDRTPIHNALEDAQGCVHGMQWLDDIKAVTAQKLHDSYALALKQCRAAETTLKVLQRIAAGALSAAELDAVHDMLSRKEQAA